MVDVAMAAAFLARPLEFSRISATWPAAPTREGLGGATLVKKAVSYPCPFGEPLQIVRGRGVLSLSFWEATPNPPILVLLVAAPNGEGWGGATLAQGHYATPNTFMFTYPTTTVS